MASGLRENGNVRPYVCRAVGAAIVVNSGGESPPHGEGRQEIVLRWTMRKQERRLRKCRATFALPR